MPTMARVKAKNVFGQVVEVCRAHYRKFCDADLKKLDQAEYINGFKNFEERVPEKYYYERRWITKYKFSIDVEVEEENINEAKQSLIDYLNEITSASDWQDHGITKMEITKNTYESHMCGYESELKYVKEWRGMCYQCFIGEKEYGMKYRVLSIASITKCIEAEERIYEKY